MTQPAKHPTPTPSPAHPQPSEGSQRPAQPTEPTEVLGRHKNSGQKDHKGAR